ncbi:MAG: hypothetical protein AAGK66_04195 [Pseudomonadota bacterium]
MSAELIPDAVQHAIDEAGLSDAFDLRGRAFVDCPACGTRAGLKLSLITARVNCATCGLEGPLLTYLRECDREPMWDEEVCEPAEIIILDAQRPSKSVTGIPERAVDRMVMDPEILNEVDSDALSVSSRRSDGRFGERLIMSLLAVVFLIAGLGAAGLSGFANYQAFSGVVADPMQASIWGWAGVIASVCSFGGFTFFWWHMSGRRIGEAMRALAFAIAGAATSIAGTALFMDNNAAMETAEREQNLASRTVVESQIEDWSRQLAGIPLETRSVEGLEAYLAGVEAAGRTHQKPYRDAQNELGLAKRRADLEQRIDEARASLLGKGDLNIRVQSEVQSLPGWLFAVMLEVFSSQGTSIAFVSLLLLYGPVSAHEDREMVQDGDALAVI